MTAYYVSNSGSDSNNGLSEANAFATPGYAASIATTVGDIIYIKADGDYNLSSTTYNASGGPMDLSNRVSAVGYGTTIDDNVKATINNNGLVPSLGLVNHDGGDSNGDPHYISNLILDGKSNGSTEVLTTLYSQGNDENLVLYNCELQGGTAGQLVYRGNSFGIAAINCVFRLRPTGAIGQIINCFADRSQVTGFDYCVNTVSKNSGVLAHFTSLGVNCFDGGLSSVCSNCIAYNEDGWFNVDTKPFGNNSRFSNGAAITNCIGWGGGVLPYFATVSTSGLSATENLAWGNFLNPFDAAGTYGGPWTYSEYYNRNTFEISEDPFVDAANNDFRLKNSGAGLQLRNNSVARNLS